jgi:uncharacterized membrane protein
MTFYISLYFGPIFLIEIMKTRLYSISGITLWYACIQQYDILTWTVCVCILYYKIIFVNKLKVFGNKSAGPQDSFVMNDKTTYMWLSG